MDKEKKLRVGYLSGIGVTDKNIDSKINYIYDICIGNSLAVIILNGGISNDYELTLRFVDLLGLRLKKSHIIMRFVFGNTDLYYDGSTLDKKSKFDFVRNELLNNKYCLITNPLTFNGVWIHGIESWYDYSLYRGKPITLSKVVKKRKFLFYNKDIKYITDNDIRYNSVEDTFDYKYTDLCINNIKELLNSMFSKYMRPNILVGVMYFYPSGHFLREGILSGYFGSFKGSLRFYDVLKFYGFRQCVVGIDSNKKHSVYGGINFFNCNRNFVIREYII